MKDPTLWQTCYEYDLNKKILENRKKISKPSPILSTYSFGKEFHNQIGPNLLSHLKLAPF
jgi:hypothetical protein